MVKFLLYNEKFFYLLQPLFIPGIEDFLYKMTKPQ